MVKKTIDPRELSRTTPLKILVCGDRDWTDSELIEKVLSEYMPEIIIHGAARGADLIAEAVAKKLEIDYKGYPAKWTRYGLPAGPRRNSHMLKENPDIGLVLAFHSDIGRSKGTLDMTKKTTAKRIPVRIVKGREK